MADQNPPSVPPPQCPCCPDRGQGCGIHLGHTSTSTSSTHRNVQHGVNCPVSLPHFLLTLADDRPDAQRPWKVPGASALAKPKGEAAPAGARNTHVSPKTSHVAQRQKHAHFNDDGYGGGGGGYHEASARQAHSSYHPERPGKGSYARREAQFEKPEDQLAYSKAPRPVEYVPYNERDYKAQYGNGYYELGKLGPDISPEELDEKRARMVSPSTSTLVSSLSFSTLPKKINLSLSDPVRIALLTGRSESRSTPRPFGTKTSSLCRTLPRSGSCQSPRLPGRR